MQYSKNFIRNHRRLTFWLNPFVEICTNTRVQSSTYGFNYPRKSEPGCRCYKLGHRLRSSCGLENEWNSPGNYSTTPARRSTQSTFTQFN